MFFESVLECMCGIDSSSYVRQQQRQQESPNKHAATFRLDPLFLSFFSLSLSLSISLSLSLFFSFCLFSLSLSLSLSLCLSLSLSLFSFHLFSLYNGFSRAHVFALARNRRVKAKIHPKSYNLFNDDPLAQIERAGRQGGSALPSDFHFIRQSLFFTSINRNVRLPAFSWRSQ